MKCPICGSTIKVDYENEIMTCKDNFEIGCGWYKRHNGSKEDDILFKKIPK